MVIVQLVKVGSEVRSFDISDNPTLGNLLRIADESFTPNTITINAQNVVSENTTLRDGDRVFIGNKVKGNTPYIVEFIRLGQAEVVRISTEGSATIGDCINMMSDTNRNYFIGGDGNDVFQYQISGVTKQSSDIVPLPSQEGGTVRVICATKVKGN